MLINKIVISQAVEVDNISMYYYMKVKNKIPYYILQQIPVSRFKLSEEDIPKVNILDIRKGFEEYEQVGNTLEFISDMTSYYFIERAYTDYISSLKTAGSEELALKMQKVKDSLLEGVKHLEVLGMTIMYPFK